MSLFKRDDHPRQRTAADRERARLEREARRAEREGRPAPAIPDELAATDHDDTHYGEQLPSHEEEPVDHVEEPAPAEDLPEVYEQTPHAHVEEPVEDLPPLIPDTPAPTEEPASEEPPAEEPPADKPPADEPAAKEPREPRRPSFLDQPTQSFDPFADEEPTAVPPIGPPDDATQAYEAVPPAEAERAEETEEAAPAPAAQRRRRRFQDDEDRPAPLRPASSRARSLPPLPPGPGERRSRVGRGGPIPLGAPRRSGRRLVAVLAIAVAIVVLMWLVISLFQPFASAGSSRVSVQIPANSSASDIGKLLERKGVISSSFFFNLRARLDGSDLRAGTYELRKDMPYADALSRLSAGPPKGAVVSVLIPEGRARREIAPVVEDAGLKGDYLKASTSSPGFRPRTYGAPRKLSTLEGFLFPATYELRPDATAADLVAKQVQAFKDNISAVDMRRARQRNLTMYDVLIIASMVEREAQIAKERPLIAAVIHNRLRSGMPLGIDATIRYVTRNWSSPLKQSELDIDSGYNTRKRTGLPPGPIGNPGIASIKAAANPAKVDHLFYVVKPGTCGEHAFSETDAEFQEDVARYNKARDEAGGKSPTTC